MLEYKQRIHDIGNHAPDYEFADLLGLHTLVERDRVP